MLWVFNESQGTMGSEKGLNLPAPFRVKIKTPRLVLKIPGSVKEMMVWSHAAAEGVHSKEETPYPTLWTDKRGEAFSTSTTELHGESWAKWSGGGDSTLQALWGLRSLACRVAP